MGVMDKFLNYMKLNEDEDGYYDDDYYDDDMEDAPAPKKTGTAKDNDDLLDEKPARKPSTCLLYTSDAADEILGG